jgi:hypothetical protein
MLEPFSFVGGSILALIAWVLAVMVGVAFYFLPGIIAFKRNAEHITPIFVLNLLLGWTFIGWVGAIIWALMDNAQSPMAPRL